MGPAGRSGAIRVRGMGRNVAVERFRAAGGARTEGVLPFSDFVELARVFDRPLVDRQDGTDERFFGPFG